MDDYFYRKLLNQSATFEPGHGVHYIEIWHLAVNYFLRRLHSAAHAEGQGKPEAEFRKGVLENDEDIKAWLRQEVSVAETPSRVSC